MRELAEGSLRGTGDAYLPNTDTKRQTAQGCVAPMRITVHTTNSRPRA